MMLNSVGLFLVFVSHACELGQIAYVVLLSRLSLTAGVDVLAPLLLVRVRIFGAFPVRNLGSPFPFLRLK